MADGTTQDLILRVTREGLYLAFLLSAPAVLAAWLAGLVVGIVQAATQIQEPIVSFFPRLLAVSVTLVALGPVLGAQLIRFSEALLLALPHLRS